MNDPSPPPPTTDDSIHDRMAAAAAEVGISRIHLVGWRDLDHPEAGGAEEHTVQLARNLTLAGLEVVHHTGAVPGAPTEIDREGVRVVRRGGKVGVFVTTVVDELSGRMGPCDGLVDVFHGAPFFAPLWCRRPQVAILHHVHLGTWHHLIPFPLDKIGHIVEERGVRVLYRRVPIVTIAESTRGEIIEKMGLRPEQVRVAPNGVDSRFRPGGERHPRPLVVAVARMMPQKGLADLLPILAAARARVPDMEAVVVGDGPQRPDLEQLRRDLGAEEWLTFAGRLDNDAVVSWYQRAWVVASASRREGFGLTLTEAAACGTPVVATRMSGHVDAVADGQSGYLAGDPQEFEHRLVELLTDHDRRRELGRGALDWASTFSWESSAAGILDALCDDARRRRARRSR